VDLILIILAWLVPLVVAYFFIRGAVHGGVREALKDHELWKREQGF
jgi:hypothetical protein